MVGCGEARAGDALSDKGSVAHGVSDCTLAELLSIHLCAGGNDGFTVK